MRENKNFLLLGILWIVEHGFGVPFLFTIGIPSHPLDRLPWGWMLLALGNDLLGGYRLGSTLCVLALTLFLKPIQKNPGGILFSAVCQTTLVVIVQLLSGIFNPVTIALFLCVSIGGPLWAGKRTASLIEIG